jgi:uncharacterized membrane protein YcaP (DUF421 family)
MDLLHALIGSEGAPISWWQMSLRGILIFCVGVLAARVAASRAFGKWSPLDIIFAVIVGSNLGRAMTGSAPFVATLVATLALVALHTALARAAARWSWLSFLVKGGRVRLVDNGEADRAAMRSVGIGDGDLQMALRTHGHTDLKQVRGAYLERNGDITLIPFDQRLSESR